MAARSSGMRTYLLRRLLLMGPTLFGIVLVVFTLCQFVPGGPIDQIRLAIAGGAGQGESGASGRSQGSMVEINETDLNRIKEFYGFNKPPVTRFVLYVKNLLKLDLGVSFRYREPVFDLLVRRLPISLFYGISTMILTYLICIPLGVAKALNHRSLFDNGTSGVIFFGYAIPSYAFGAVLLVFFAVRTQLFPLAGFKGENFADLSLFGKIKDIAHHAVLPLASYMIGAFAVMTMLMKNSLMENMGADYVKTALAKGLNWKTTIYVHAFRNSLIPLATSFGGNITLILTGSVLIERVFGIPGMGLLFFEAIQARDYPIVLGFVFVGAVLSMIGHLISDMCVAAVDPRVRFS